MNISSAINAIPTAAGAAMPATGIIKLKSKTGTFQDNETLEITGSTDLCLANGIGYRGWIEVVMDDATAYTISRSQKARALGDWFVSETLTNATRAQQIQFPNYGGANFFLPGVEVETAAGSGVYEKWPSMLSVAASGWAMLAGGMAAAQGTTDGRSKFVRCLGGGIVQFGESLTQAATYTWATNAVVVTFTAHGRQVGQQIYLDFTSGGATADGLYTITAVAANTMTVTLTGSGTAGNVTVRYDMGAVPVTGCKVRVPNIFLKSAATGSRASDSVPNGTLATRPDFTVTNAGQFDFEKVTGHWQFNLGQGYSVRMKDLHTFDQVTITECATALDVVDVCIGNYTMGDTFAMVLTSNFAGGVVNYCEIGRCGVIGNTDYCLSVANCNNISFTGNEFGARTLRTSASGYVANFSQCKGLTFQDNILIGHGMQIASCIDTIINGTRYADNYTDVSLAITPPVGAIMITGYSVNTKVDGFTYHLNLTNVHPDTALVYIAAAIKFRMQNVATRVAPLTGGSVNQLLLMLNDAGNSSEVSIKRCYMNNLATRLFASVNSTKGWIVENCAGDYGDTDTTPALNGIIKNLACASWPTSGASIYGTIWAHIFTSTTAGRLGLAFNEPTSDYAAYVTTLFTTTSTGKSGFNSNGGLALINSGDYAIFEFPWTIKGIDSFQNSAPTVTTATNITTEYQIDTGSGWSAWKTFNAANLFAEVVDEVAGFKFKIRVTANATNAANILTVVYALTNSNTTAQDIQYALDTSIITVQNVIPNSRVRITRTDNGAVLYNDLVTGTSKNYEVEYLGEVRVEVRFGNTSTPYKPWFTLVTVGTGVTVNALQEPDYEIVLPLVATPVLTATVISSTQIDLSCVDVANDVGYLWEKSTDNVNWTTIETTATNDVTSSATGLTPSTLYYFRVTALGNGINYLNSLYGTDSDTTSAASGLSIASSDTATGTTSSVNNLTGVPAGAVLVLTLSNADDWDIITGDASVSSSPSLTWTKRAETYADNTGTVEIWTAVFAAGGNIDVTANWGVGSYCSAVCYAVTGQEATLSGASASAVNETAPALPITTTRDGSIVFGVISDWQPIDGASRTIRNSATETFYVYQAGAYTAYFFYKLVPTAGAAGNFGYSAPTGQDAGIALYELRKP